MRENRTLAKLIMGYPINIIGITLTDLCETLNNPSLKEVCLNAEEEEENLEEKLTILKKRMPNCEIVLY